MYWWKTEQTTSCPVAIWSPVSDPECPNLFLCLALRSSSPSGSHYQALAEKLHRHLLHLSSDKSRAVDQQVVGLAQVWIRLHTTEHEAHLQTVGIFPFFCPRPRRRRLFKQDTEVDGKGDLK
ncbi:hypothetical protein MHYP_G00224300 [Metynnis hypsauchen]